MGKNLKGKECGKGICQGKGGFYYARFVDKYGKRHEKYVPTRPEARNWLEEARFTDTQENMIADLSPNTRRNYRERYAAEGFTEAAGSLRHSNNDEPLCPCDR